MFLYAKEIKKISLALFFVSLLIFSPSLLKANDNDTIHIRITDVTWPPSYYFWENYTAFGIGFLVEIWNPGENKTVTTPHSNLLDPHMIVDLEGFYGEYEGAPGLCVITGHVISSGYTNLSAGHSFWISDYNNTLPPFGEITVWSELDAYTTTFDVISYNATLTYNSTGVFFQGLEIEFSTPFTTTLVLEELYLFLAINMCIFSLYKKKRGQ